jgi:hypothetical protein
MLIVCWPLLSAVPRPYQLPSRSARTQGGEPHGLSPVEPVKDVAMGVAEHRDRVRALDPLGIEERSARPCRLVHDGAGQAHALEGRAKLRLQIALELGRPLRVLTFGRDRNATGEVALERAGGEAIESCSDSQFRGTCACCPCL